MPLPEYAERNRIAWTKLSEWFESAGRRCWATSEITWGIWSIPETALGALGPLEDLRGKDVIELGCGTGYFSGWFAKLGAKPVGIDVTPAQLDRARAFQKEFGYEYPLIEGNAEEVPLPDASFDLAFSEYGASIWCDPYRWIPEAARLLRPGGRLIFLKNSTLSMLCMPPKGPVTESLQRPLRGMHRLEWEDDDSVEFHIPASAMVRLLSRSGFVVDDLIDVYPPDGSATDFDYMTPRWAGQWPSEEIWVATLAPAQAL